MAFNSDRLNRPFRGGTAIGAAFELFFSRIGLFLAVAAISYLPYLLSEPGVELLIHAIEPSNTEAVAGVFVGLFEMVIGGLMTGFVTYIVVMQVNGSPSSIGRALSQVARKILWIVLASVLVSIPIVIGFVLLVLPGLMVMVVLWVTIPAVVSERLGPLAAMKRSHELTRGHRWSILGVVLVFLLLLIGVGVAFQYAFLPLGVMAGYPVVTSHIIGAFNNLAYIFGSIAAAYGYVHLKMEKEGTSVSELVKMFE